MSRPIRSCASTTCSGSARHAVSGAARRGSVLDGARPLAVPGDRAVRVRDARRCRRRSARCCVRAWPRDEEGFGAHWKRSSRDATAASTKPRRSVFGRPRALTRAQIATVLAWHDSRVTLKQLAASMNVSTSTVAHAIASRGAALQTSATGGAGREPEGASSAQESSAGGGSAVGRYWPGAVHSASGLIVCAWAVEGAVRSGCASEGGVLVLFAVNAG